LSGLDERTSDRARSLSRSAYLLRGDLERDLSGIFDEPGVPVEVEVIQVTKVRLCLEMFSNLGTLPPSSILALLHSIMTWHRLSQPLLRATTLRRHIRTQPIYEQHPHTEDDVPHKQLPSFGLATPRQVVI
jgi:hypothetical protein